jgi:hypothetical protein
MGKRKDLLVAVRPTMSVPAGAPMFGISSPSLSSADLDLDCFGAFVAISSGLPSYEGMDFVIPTSLISGSYYATVGRPMVTHGRGLGYKPSS